MERVCDKAPRECFPGPRWLSTVVKWEAKNTQNFGRFSTTSVFDCDYPRNGTRYRKSENSARFPTTFDFDQDYLRNGSSCRKSEKPSSTTTPSTLEQKKMVDFGPQTKLWWLILTNQSGHFSGDYIKAIRGCCPLKFLSALEIDQGYLAHTPTGTGVTPPQKKYLIAKI